MSLPSIRLEAILCIEEPISSLPDSTDCCSVPDKEYGLTITLPSSLDFASVSKLGELDIGTILLVTLLRMRLAVI